MYIEGGCSRQTPREAREHQKVHRSCTWLAEASGGCRLESSPLRLFLHTGHVSCSSNQGTMQLLWKKWLQGSCRTCSATA